MPSTEAQRQWEQAMAKRARYLEQKIAVALQKKRGLWALYVLIQKTDAYKATTQGDLQRAQEAAQAPEMRALLQLLASPSWKAVHRVEAQCGRRFSLIDYHHDGRSGMADLLAQALGIDPGPVPRLREPEGERARR